MIPEHKLGSSHIISNQSINTLIRILSNQFLGKTERKTSDISWFILNINKYNKQTFQNKLYWKNDHSLNERLYWTIVQLENEQNRWKINVNFENKLNQFVFERLKQNTNEMGRSRTMKEQNEIMRQGFQRPSPIY